MSVFLLTLAVQLDGIRRFIYQSQLNGSAKSTPGHLQAVADLPRAASPNNFQRWLGELIKKIDKGGYIDLQDNSTYLVCGSTGLLSFYAIKRK